MDPSLSLLARRQRGAFSRRQALEHMSVRTVDRRLATGQWRRLLPATYADASVPDSLTLRAHAAVLYAGTGAVLSHGTAAALHGIDAGPIDALHLSVPYPRSVASQPGLAMHRSRRLDGAAITSKRRLPLTSPTRTLLDLAAILRRPMLDAAVADATRRGLVSTSYLNAQLELLGGRHETGLIQEMLRDFDPKLESILEREYAAAVHAAELALGTPQHEIWDGCLLVARVDFAYVERKLAIEIDGYTYHSRLEQFENDRRRERALSQRGWEVLRFVTSDVRKTPDAMVAELRTRLASPVPKAV